MKVNISVSKEELMVKNKELEKKLEERTNELKDLGEKFKTIADNSLMGIALIQDNKIKYVNKQSTVLTGYTVEETMDLSPIKIFDFVHPKDRIWVLEQLRKKQSGLKDYLTDYQFRIINRSGEIRWIDIHSRSVDYMGRPADLISVTDITERKHAEQKLKESEERFKFLVSSNPAIIYTSKVTGDYGATFISNNVQKKWGYSSEDFINDSEFWLNKVHPDDREHVLTELSDMLEKDYVGIYEYRFKLKDGTYHWMRDEIELLKDKEGNPIEIIGSVIDITERKIAEQKLKESEEKYRHLYENSPFSIVLLDYEGKIIDMNTKTTTLFGYEKEDLIGKNYLDLTGIYPSDTKPGLRLIPELISKWEPGNPIMKPQITEIYNKEKELIWAESELSSINISGEQMIQVIIQDVTEKKMAEEKLKESERMLREQNIELKELDRLKTDFISIAAHDLKTPLISVGGYVDLILLREKGLKEEVKEDLNRVLNNVHRLEDYINRLLDVMKIEAKKVELVKREENIHDIIINCISDLEFQIGKKNLTINLDISEDLKLRVDRFKISQVFLNLLSNAIKFTPKDGKVNISNIEDDETFVFSIKDNGKGLTPEEKQKLFGKFVTIEQGVDGYSTLDKGSGLGLYIAKGFIEAHGGKIWAESKGRDLGTEFSFVLPKQ